MSETSITTSTTIRPDGYPEEQWAKLAPAAQDWVAANWDRYGPALLRLGSALGEPPQITVSPRNDVEDADAEATAWAQPVVVEESASNDTANGVVDPDATPEGILDLGDDEPAASDGVAAIVAVEDVQAAEADAEIMPTMSALVAAAEVARESRASPGVVGPWVEEDGSWVRRDAGGDTAASVRGHSWTAVDTTSGGLVGEVGGSCDGLDDGKARADAALRLAGWVLPEDEDAVVELKAPNTMGKTDAVVPGDNELDDAPEAYVSDGFLHVRIAGTEHDIALPLRDGDADSRSCVLGWASTTTDAADEPRTGLALRGDAWAAACLLVAGIDPPQNAAQGSGLLVVAHTYADIEAAMSGREW